MYLADALSRAHIKSSANSQGEFELINMASFLAIGEERLRLKEETDKDRTLQKLLILINQGWPEGKHLLPYQLTPYYNFRDEMSVQEGLIFKGERVVVPKSLRLEMKSEVHSTHSGIEGCLKRVRESLFWPGMTGDTKHYISTCEMCQAFQLNQQKETLMNHEVHTHPWEKVGVDLFTLDGKDYLVCVDYYSNFCEVDRLENTSSETVIRKLKAHFARYGIPSTVVSDNGPQLSSDIFAKFVNDWSFNHLTSSPHYPRSNGKAKSAVKTEKTLFLKNKDQFMALLNHKSTANKTGTSPSQAFFNRRIRTLLPIAKSLLKPQVLDPRQLQQRSYAVESGGGVYRRNILHLRRIPLPAETNAPTQTGTTEPDHPAPVDAPSTDKSTAQRPESHIEDVSHWSTT
uniref:Integrase catalytic domain-containing protein n=1 Tax=Biomphalaria glabrata TaxID=6526 RepID=A0A2C9M976_BIOGL